MTDASPRALVRAQVALESFALHPAGSSVVYVLRRVRGDDYVSHLWARRWRGGRARQLTRGSVRDASPALSPDGGQVAFLRTAVGPDDAVAQVWLLPLDGGEPYQVTTLEHGVRSLRWSPNGDRLLLVAQAGDHRFIIGEEKKGRTPLARRITRLDFRDDESGHVVRRSHLWVVAPRTGSTPRQLTSGDFDVHRPAWSPDGRRIAFGTNRDRNGEIYVMNADGTGQRRLTRTPEHEFVLGWSPDGRKLAFGRYPAKPRWAFFVMNADGSGARKITWSLPAGS
jgi:Tol biopolymer transport system component